MRPSTSKIGALKALTLASWVPSAALMPVVQIFACRRRKSFNTWRAGVAPRLRRFCISPRSMASVCSAGRNAANKRPVADVRSGMIEPTRTLSVTG